MCIQQQPTQEKEEPADEAAAEEGADKAADKEEDEAEEEQEQAEEAKPAAEAEGEGEGDKPAAAEEDKAAAVEAAGGAKEAETNGVDAGTPTKAEDADLEVKVSPKKAAAASPSKGKVAEGEQLLGVLGVQQRGWEGMCVLCGLGRWCLFTGMLRRLGI